MGRRGRPTEGEGGRLRGRSGICTPGRWGLGSRANVHGGVVHLPFSIRLNLVSAPPATLPILSGASGVLIGHCLACSLPCPARQPIAAPPDGVFFLIAHRPSLRPGSFLPRPFLASPTAPARRASRLQVRGARDGASETLSSAEGHTAGRAQQCGERTSWLSFAGS